MMICGELRRRGDEGLEDAEGEREADVAGEEEAELVVGRVAPAAARRHGSRREI